MLVPPVHFGPALQENLRQVLCSAVEWKVESQHGSYVLAVIEITRQSPGKLSNSGNAVFQVEYDALVQKNFNGEVLEGIVSRIIPPSAATFRVGALTAYIRIAPDSSTNEGYKYDENLSGFVNVQGNIVLKEEAIARIRLISCGIPGNMTKMIAELL